MSFNTQFPNINFIIASSLHAEYTFFISTDFLVQHHENNETNLAGGWILKQILCCFPIKNLVLWDFNVAWQTQRNPLKYTFTTNHQWLRFEMTNPNLKGKRRKCYFHGFL